MNWKETIAEIQAFNWTQPQIAAECGCGQATISDLFLEKTVDPRHSLGQSLIALRDRLRAAAAVDAGAKAEPARSEPSPLSVASAEA